MIADEIPALRPDGYEEYQKMTSRDLAEAADRNVKWIQTAVSVEVKWRGAQARGVKQLRL
ncbi:MAG TPA: hypothetical protein VHG29_08405 [Novosphingobium sp.]|nr:hypothetical protein [Novosphingobium sp.]